MYDDSFDLINFNTEEDYDAILEETQEAIFKEIFFNLFEEVPTGASI